MNDMMKSVFLLTLSSFLIAGTNSASQASDRVYFFHNDHLGTPQAITDLAGRTVWTAEYEPFGKAEVDQDPDGDGRQVVNNLRFPGQYYDAETGLHYNWHRDYDPETGRYLQPDPIGLAGGLNPYSYVSNSPINWDDPLGLWADDASWWTNMGNRLNVMWRAVRHGELNALEKEFEGQFREIAEMDPVDFAMSFSPGAPGKLGACKSARGLDDILKNEEVFARFLRRKHPTDSPYSPDDARKIWNKILDRGLSPRMDPPHPNKKWNVPHINVDGTTIHIPIDPRFKP